MNIPVFDTRQVRRAFARAAPGYAAAARLQREIQSRLLDSLAFHEATPAVVLDVGCGPGHASVALQKRWPKARVLALDLALPMLREARRQAGGWNPFAHRPEPICADVRALPLADDSVDVVFSNLCVQWIDDLPALFAGFRRVLRPGGLLLLSTFGPDTLWELRDAFAHADATPHVSPFADIARFGDALMHAGFRDPVLDRDVLTTHYPELGALMREQRATGATNALATRRHTLTGKSRFAAAAAAYEALRDGDGLPASWEVITALAWAPQEGQPIRSGGVDVARISASRIPVRRR
ncbi:MAG: malonyl-ACP O-methyltransferase BioC [Lysobacteraceae bacterium]